MLSDSGRGFTLIEVLVGLVILTLVASVAIRSQMLTLGIEERLRVMPVLRLTIRTVTARNAVGLVTNAESAYPAGITVLNKSIETGAGTNRLAWTAWSITLNDASGMEDHFFTVGEKSASPP